MAEQLGFDLPSRPALERDAFFVSPANAVPLAMIDGWSGWREGKLVLTGPKGSGKTHLAHVWAEMSGARIIRASDLDEAMVPALASGPTAIEDVPAIAGDTPHETALFHLHNLARAEGQALLFTGTGDVTTWGITLPDLLSRLQGATVAALLPPDDQLLAALLVKLFADRQMTPRADLIPYLLGRMDRSFAATIDLVQRLDAASIALKRPITRQLAATVLDNPPAEA